MLASHYAPATPVVLVDSIDAAEVATAGRRARILHDDDLVRYAQRLYADLRAADESGAEVIVAVLPPAAGLGHAIRDRLLKPPPASSGGRTRQPGSACKPRDATLPAA